MNFKRLKKRKKLAAPPAPPTPCKHRPGSEERIACYRDRARKGYAIFHPDDEVLIGYELPPFPDELAGELPFDVPGTAKYDRGEIDQDAFEVYKEVMGC